MLAKRRYHLFFMGINCLIPKLLATVKGFVGKKAAGGMRVGAPISYIYSLILSAERIYLVYVFFVNQNDESSFF